MFFSFGKEFNKLETGSDCREEFGQAGQGFYLNYKIKLTEAIIRLESGQQL